MKSILSEEEFIEYKKDLININYIRLAIFYTVAYFVCLMVFNTFIFKTRLYNLPFSAINAVICGVIFSFVSKKSVPREIEKNLKNTLPDHLFNEAYDFFIPSTYILSKSIVSRGYLLFNETSVTYISLKNKLGCKDFPLTIRPETHLYTGSTKTDFLKRVVSERPIDYLIIEQNGKKYNFQVHNPDKIIAHIQSLTKNSQSNLEII